jgi:hypothetical protein
VSGKGSGQTYTNLAGEFIFPAVRHCPPALLYKLKIIFEIMKMFTKIQFKIFVGKEKENTFQVMYLYLTTVIVNI